MSSNQASHQIEIAAPIETVFSVITDYETIDQWQSAIISCEVLEPAKGSRGELVEFHINAMIRKVRYVLRYHYEPPYRLTWDFIEGDVRSIEGEYRFEEVGPSSTVAHYHLSVDPGIFVPEPIRNTLADRAMLQALQDLKARAEQVAGS